MIELYKQSILAQYEATLSMLKQRIEVCPDEYWDTMVGQASIRQDAYHVLFFLDLYLTAHEDLFSSNEYSERGGDELQPQISPGLSKEDTLAYLELCHRKAIDSLAQETEQTLKGNSGFPSIFRRRPLSRAELHMYNIRHLQHHMAQIGMALRKLSDEHNLELTLQWYSTGWHY